MADEVPAPSAVRLSKRGKHCVAAMAITTNIKCVITDGTMHSHELSTINFLRKRVDVFSSVTFPQRRGLSRIHLILFALLGVDADDWNVSQRDFIGIYLGAL